MDADVIIVGAGPAGLMLAGELGLAGVRPLILECQPGIRDVPKAYGINGQIVELLRRRGVLDRFEAAGTTPVHAAVQIPFGGVHLDFTGLVDPPLQGLGIPQPRLERLLGERATELGAEVRRAQEVTALSQDDAGVTVAVRGRQVPYRARYLVGCDGGNSLVRRLAGIPFAGTGYPEVNRLAQVTMTTDPDVPPGFTRTDTGVFGWGRFSSGELLVQTTEDEPAGAGDDEPMTLAEFQESVRRVLGVELPVAQTNRLSRYRFQARQAQRYRDGRVLLAGDAAHLFPATGIGLNAGLLDTVNLAWKLAATVQGWAPAGLLDTYHDERHRAGARTMLHTQAQVALRRGTDAAADALRDLFVELCTDEQPLRRMGSLIAGADTRHPLPAPGRHPLTGTFAPDLAVTVTRPVLVDLADRADLRGTARDWRHRVDIVTAPQADRPADAVLIRPDVHVAWAATVGEPAETAAPALRDALTRWFGAPADHTQPPLPRPVHSEQTGQAASSERRQCTSR